MYSYEQTVTFEERDDAIALRCLLLSYYEH